MTNEGAWILLIHRPNTLSVKIITFTGLNERNSFSNRCGYCDIRDIPKVVSPRRQKVSSSLCGQSARPSHTAARGMQLPSLQMKLSCSHSWPALPVLSPSAAKCSHSSYLVCFFFLFSPCRAKTVAGRKDKSSINIHLMRKISFDFNL